jgi:hypothetical protein
VPTPRRTRPSAAALLIVVAGGACSRGESRPVHAAAAADPGRATDRSLARGDRVATAGDVTPPGVRPTQPAYRVAPAADAGSVTGVVVLDGPPPADTTFAPAAADRRACGAALAERAVDLDRAAPGAAPGGADGDAVRGVRGAVVWLEGVPAGKAMPAARRYELAVDGCRLVPRHLAVAAGGTLNVHGVDDLETRLRFARAAGPPGAAAADAGLVLLRTSMTAAGQVVPDERVLDRAGAVEVREDARPWLRAWVLAFDQPYFAATAAGGAFALADVPPGSYRLVAWHERLGRVVTPVTVAAGQPTGVTVRMQAPAAPPAQAAAAAAP